MYVCMYAHMHTCARAHTHTHTHTGREREARAEIESRITLLVERVRRGEHLFTSEHVLLNASALRERSVEGGHRSEGKRVERCGFEEVQGAMAGEL